MSFVDDLLVILSDYHGGYRLIRRRIRGYTGPARGVSRHGATAVSDGYLDVALARLKRRGFVERETRGIWRITAAGREYLKKKLRYRRVGTKQGTNVKRSKNLIVAFDIPERYRKERDWLRVELRNLGFEMLQKSVWFGPTPLPRDFIESLAALKILPCFKFFEAKESHIIGVRVGGR